MNTVERLAYMANQIARNFATLSDAEAAKATAAHIIDFWDPRMIAGLLASDMSTLSPVAADAMRQVEAARSARAA